MLLATTCQQRKYNFEKNTQPTVYIAKTSGKYELVRNGKPYQIKGASGASNLEMLHRTGGNSVTVYEQKVTREFLDSAHGYEISVSIILDVVKPMHGGNYHDMKFKKDQRDRIIRFVKENKEHPAVLFWIIGNELHLGQRFNWRMWHEINQLSKIIHEIDPNHPTTTTLAGFGLESMQIVQMKLFCPDLDFVSHNLFDSYHRLYRESRNFIWGYEGPYVVTEFSPLPYWNMSTTEWDAVIEPTGANRAIQMKQRYKSLTRDTERCLGTYVFYWGEKQERTHTVFSLLLQNQYKTQSVEALYESWNGQKPPYYCPRINDFSIVDHPSLHEIYLESGQFAKATFEIDDPDHDLDRIVWEILAEGRYHHLTGGDKEAQPECIIDDVLEPDVNAFEFQIPITPGPYRLFLYVYDKNDNVGTANIPFYVLKRPV